MGTRKRSEFLERPAINQLRKEAFDRWVTRGENFKGLTPEDTYRLSREEMEKRGG